MACASASRELLGKAVIMHSVYPSTTGGRCMHDTLAAIAGLTLMLAHATSHQNEDANLLRHQRMADRASVQRAIECIQSVRDEREEALALKCAALLQDLLVVEDEIAKEREFPDSADETDTGSILMLRVPYIGHVTISRRGFAIMAPTTAEQLEASDHDITLGGIGSIRASHPNTPGHEERASDVHDQTSATWRLMYKSTAQSGSGTLGNPLSQDTIGQTEPMFPNAAAGLDDWSFQGLDTAFFDNLMRGSSSVLPDANLDWNWDTTTTWPGRSMDAASTVLNP
nr:hypothetical protein B0A51_06685 [Rachicladosporium sp. CCFEE 5018]